MEVHRVISSDKGKILVSSLYKGHGSDFVILCNCRVHCASKVRASTISSLLYSLTSSYDACGVLMVSISMVKLIWPPECCWIPGAASAEVVTWIRTELFEDDTALQNSSANSLTCQIWHWLTHHIPGISI